MESKMFEGAALVIDVQASRNVAVRVSYRTNAAENAGKLVSEKITVNESLPLQLRVTQMVIHVMNQLRAAKYKGRVLMLVQEAAFLKMLQLASLRGKKNTAEELMAVWMWDTDFADDYQNTFKELANSYRRALNAGIRFTFRNSRELYRFKLEGAIDNLTNGENIVLKDSVNEELGVAVDDRVTINGTYRVQLENASGNYHAKAYVWRPDPRLRDDGTGISDADEELRVLRMIHDETRKQLPRRTEIVKKVQVIDSLKF